MDILTQTLLKSKLIELLKENNATHLILSIDEKSKKVIFQYHKKQKQNEFIPERGGEPSANDIG